MYKIFLIEWVRGEDFGCTAVVIAKDQTQAMEQIEFGEFDADFSVKLIGYCDADIDQPDVVCMEVP